MKILFAGDVNFLSFAFDGQSTKNMLNELKYKFEECDYVIPNLECPLVNKENYKPIKKSGPNLACNPDNITFLKGMNTYGVTLANNHIGDFGEDAVKDTMTFLKNNGIVFSGAGENIDKAYSPLRIDKDGLSVSVISVCENEFGVATQNMYGSAGYNPRLLLKAINKERQNNRFVIVVFHGGNEHCPVPSPDTVDRYRFICDMGADAVIGGHTHCPQGYEIYGGKPIVYSMGNFLFPKDLEKDSLWYFGYMCELEIGEKIELKTVPYRYEKDNRIFIDLSNNEKFLSYLKVLSNTIKNENLLKLCFDKWAVMSPWCPTLPDGTEIYNPYPNYNLINCEAHLSKLKAFLKLQCEGDCEDYEREEVRMLYNFDYF